MHQTDAQVSPEALHALQVLPKNAVVLLRSVQARFTDDWKLVFCIDQKETTTGATNAEVSGPADRPRTSPLY